MAPIKRPQPTEQEIAEATAMYQAGTKIWTIAKSFDSKYSRDIWSRILVPEYRETRKGYIQKLREEKHKKIWTPEREEKFLRLWNEDVAYSKIAERIGVTVGMVAGKAQRMGLRREKKITLTNMRVLKKGRRFDGGKITAIKSRLARVDKELPEAEIPQPSALMLELDQLQRNSCRWPVTSHDAKPNEHLFCGAHTSMRYCEYHARKSVQRKEAA